MITLGVDEVGRGPLAGPMVVGAVILGEIVPDGLADSKKLSPKKRRSLSQEIKKQARAIGVGWVSAGTIDRIGLGPALKLAARRAVSQITADFDQIIIDGKVKLLDDPRATTMTKADSKIKAVSAAAIIAKVARDDYMAQVALLWPEYGFAAHKGYGSAAHLAAIRQYGATPIHRQSFAPLASKAKPNKVGKTVGRVAEAVAASWLQAQGHEVLAQNWRTKLVEIDLISQKGAEVYFFEVKYRRSDQAGDGLAAITAKKLAQMKKGVLIWQKLQNDQRQPHLAAIAMSGQPPEVVDFVEIN